MMRHRAPHTARKQGTLSRELSRHAAGLIAPRCTSYVEGILAAAGGQARSNCESFAVIQTPTLPAPKHTYSATDPYKWG